MAIAPSNQTQRRGDVSVLMPPPPPPVTALSRCLAQIERRWTEEGHLAGLWLAWPRLVGPQLAPHCRPLSLRGGMLMIGAPPGPWLQALQYNRHQLLGSLRGAGFSVRELRVQQHNPLALPRPAAEVEAATWAAHPSRVDVHGMATCPCCARPAPAGELERWRRCSFCQRELFAAAALRVSQPAKPKPSDTNARASLRRQHGSFDRGRQLNVDGLNGGVDGGRQLIGNEMSGGEDPSLPVRGVSSAPVGGAPTPRQCRR